MFFFFFFFLNTQKNNNKEFEFFEKVKWLLYKLIN